MWVKMNFIVLLFVSLVFATSIEILPGIASFDFLPIGYSFDMKKTSGTMIAIPNHNDVPIQYQVLFSNNKEVGSLLPGYANFPDISWCKVIPDTPIWVQPHDTGWVNLVINIPNKPEYLNQYWELGVVVTPLQGMSMQVGGVQIGITPTVMGSFLISTMPAADVNPKGRKTGITPSAVNITTDDAIKGRRFTFTIFNNDSVAHEYHIVPYEFPIFPAHDVKLSIQVFTNHEIGDISCLKYKKGFLFFKKNIIRVEPGKSAQWTVDLKMPDKPEIKEKEGWDFVIQILPEGQKIDSGIFRITTHKKIPWR